MIGICERCGNERRIYVKKLCHPCYNYIHRNKKKTAERNKQWQKDHLKYWRDYYKKKKEGTK